jgi:hypothetical protein
MEGPWHDAVNQERHEINKDVDCNGYGQNLEQSTNEKTAAKGSQNSAKVLDRVATRESR